MEENFVSVKYSGILKRPQDSLLFKQRQLNMKEILVFLIIIMATIKIELHFWLFWWG